MNEIRCAIELRVDNSRQSPGRIVGTLLRYGERASDRPELFEVDALTWPDAGIILNRQHERSAPVMRFKPESRDGAVYIDAALPDTSAGRDTATEIREGLFRGLSIEFRAVKQRMDGGVRRIAKAVLSGASIVDSPSYTGSAVEVRHQSGGREIWL